MPWKPGPRKSWGGGKGKSVPPEPTLEVGEIPVPEPPPSVVVGESPIRIEPDNPDQDPAAVEALLTGKGQEYADWLNSTELLADGTRIAKTDFATLPLELQGFGKARGGLELQGEIPRYIERQEFKRAEEEAAYKKALADREAEINWRMLAINDQLQASPELVTYFKDIDAQIKKYQDALATADPDTVEALTEQLQKYNEYREALFWSISDLPKIAPDSVWEWDEKTGKFVQVPVQYGPEAPPTQAATQEADRVRALFSDVFHDEDVQKMLEMAETNPDRFMADFRLQGMTPSSVKLLKELFPDITDDEIAGFFPQFGPEDTRLKDTFNAVFPSIPLKDFDSWAKSNPDEMMKRIQQAGRTAQTEWFLEQIVKPSLPEDAKWEDFLDAVFTPPQKTGKTPPSGVMNRLDLSDALKNYGPLNQPKPMEVLTAYQDILKLTLGITAAAISKVVPLSVVQDKMSEIWARPGLTDGDRFKALWNETPMPSTKSLKWTGPIGFLADKLGYELPFSVGFKGAAELLVDPLTYIPVDITVGLGGKIAAKLAARKQAEVIIKEEIGTLFVTTKGELVKMVDVAAKTISDADAAALAVSRRKLISTLESITKKDVSQLDDVSLKVVAETGAELQTLVEKQAVLNKAGVVSENIAKGIDDAIARLDDATKDAGVVPPSVPKAVVDVPKSVETPKGAVEPVPSQAPAPAPVAKVTESVTTPPKVPAPERAGNILLEKYPEEVRPILKQWADSHPSEIAAARRGVRSDAQVLADSKALVDDVGGNWTPGVSMNAEEILALRGALRGKTEEVLALQKAVAKDNSVENLLKLELAIKEQVVVQEAVTGVTAEAGRALRQFRQQVGDATGDAAKLEQILKQVGGREKTEKVAAELAKLDIDNLVAVNNFLRNVDKPGMGDYISELYYNSILSGPKTHIINTSSNTVNAIMSSPERLAAAVVEAGLAKVQGRARQRFFSEIPADAWGAIEGFKDGLGAWGHTMKYGITPEMASKFEMRGTRAFTGKLGRVINFPSTNLEAADALMYQVNYRAALRATAKRMSKDAESYAELLVNPTKELMAEASKVAEYRLFRQPAGKTATALMSALDSVSFKGIKPLRYLVPFVRTPANLLKYGLERSPAGWMNPKLWKNVAAKSPEASDQIARAAIGSVVAAGIATYVLEGRITGAAPTNLAERDRFYREGKQPFAIRIGDSWVSYQRVEPFNQTFGQVAAVLDAVRNKDKDVAGKAAQALSTISQNLVSQTYLSGLSSVLDMLTQPERYAPNVLTNFLTALGIPMSSAMRTAAQTMDRTIRQPTNLIESFKAGIPGLSKGVPPKLDVFGQEVTRKSPAWLPINITPVEETILSQELERRGFNIGAAGKSIDGVTLTRDEQADYQIMVGGFIKKDLERLMGTPDYWMASDVERDKMLQKVVDGARDWAQFKTRQKLWSSGTTEERMVKLANALNESDKQLGKMTSVVPEFSHESPEIYDVAGKLDSSYKALLKGIPESSTSMLNVPPTVASWYQKESAMQEALAFIDQPLYKLNTDAAKGSTFEDLFKQWDKRSRITDEKELAEFDKQYPDAQLGSFGRRNLELLRTYQALTKEEQEKFLKANPDIALNSRTEWLKKNPTQNALLAIWDKEPVVTYRAYEEAKRIIKELDLPDSVIPKGIFPPENIAREYFDYQDLLKTVDDQSAEAMLYRVDHPDYNAWRTDATVHGIKALMPIEEARIPVWRIDVKFRTEDKEYDAIDPKAKKLLPNGESISLRDAYLQDIKNVAYAKARIERTGYQMDLDASLISEWVEYNQLPEYGAWRERYRKEHPEFDASVKKVQSNPWADLDDKIPAEPYDKIYEQFKDKFKQYENVQGTEKEREAQRDAIFEGDPKFKEAWYRREAYGILLPEDKIGVGNDGKEKNFIELFVEYALLPDKGFERERILLNNPEFDALLEADVPENVPDERFDILTKKYPQFDELDKLEGEARETRARELRFKTISSGNDFKVEYTEFGLAELERDAWKAGVPAKLINDYVQFRKIQNERTETKKLIADQFKDEDEKYAKLSDFDQKNYLKQNTAYATWKKNNELPNYEDDWYLIEHPEFASKYYPSRMADFKDELKVDGKVVAYGNVPVKDVFDKYLAYERLATTPQALRLTYRRTNKDLDAWLVKAKGMTPIGTR